MESGTSEPEPSAHEASARRGEQDEIQVRVLRPDAGVHHRIWDALISADGPQGTILTSIVSTGPAVRASAVALGALVGEGVRSPDRRDTCRRASRLGSAVHRTGRSNPNRERSVRASQLVVSWCPPCGPRGSAPFPVVTVPPTGPIHDSGLRHEVRLRLFSAFECVAQGHDQATQTDPNGQAGSACDEKEGHARFLRADAVRCLRRGRLEPAERWPAVKPNRLALIMCTMHPPNCRSVASTNTTRAKEPLDDPGGRPLEPRQRDAPPGLG